MTAAADPGPSLDTGPNPGPSTVAHPYQYVVLRVVPRADREEFVNVGVLLYCQQLDYLACAVHTDPARLRALFPALDLVELAAGLAGVQAACSGSPGAGAAAALPLGPRFGWLTAPRSTALRTSGVHGGTCGDEPELELAALLAAFVTDPT